MLLDSGFQTERKYNYDQEHRMMSGGVKSIRNTACSWDMLFEAASCLQYND